MRPRLALLLTITPILILTLSSKELPTGAINPITTDHFGLADMLVNVALFLPFGAALRFSGRRLWVIALWALALSFTVEALQLFIPRRYPSVSDLITNTAGGFLGGVAFMAWRALLLPGPRLTALYTALYAAALAALMALTPYMLAPHLPRGVPYTAYWRIQRPHLVPFEGATASARLEGRALAHKARLDVEATRAALMGGAPLIVEAEGRATEEGLGSIFSVYDAWGREVVMIGAHEADLLVRFWTRSAPLYLHRRPLRIEGVFSDAPQRLVVEARLTPEDLSVTVNGRRYAHLGARLEHSWMMPLNPIFHRLPLDLPWAALLLLPLGYLRPRRGLAIGVGVALGGILIGLWIWSPLEASGVGALWAAAGGVVGGWWLRRLAQRRLDPLHEGA